MGQLRTINCLHSFSGATRFSGNLLLIICYRDIIYVLLLTEILSLVTIYSISRYSAVIYAMFFVDVNQYGQVHDLDGLPVQEGPRAAPRARSGGA